MPEVIEPGPERYPECLEVLRIGFGTQLAEYGITPENDPDYPSFWPDDHIARLVARPTTLLAASDGDRLVGCCFIGPSRHRSDAWTLRHLAVVPAARHSGHGRLLVAEAARRARTAGVAVVRIGIVAENVLLSHWYHQLGFVTTQAGMHYGTLPFTVDHLELRLTGTTRGSSSPSSISIKR